MRNLLSVISILALLILANSNPASAQPNIEDAIEVIDWSPNGEKIAVGYTDGKVAVVDTSTSVQIQSWEEHTDKVTGIAWSPNGDRLVSGSYDNTLRVWDIAQENSVATLTDQYMSDVLAVGWSPDNTIIIDFEFSSQSVRTWDAQTYLPLSTYYESAAWSVTWSPNGNEILLGNAGGGIAVRDASSFEDIYFSGDYIINNETGQYYGIFATAWSSDGNLIAGGNLAGITIIWDASDGDFVSVFDADDLQTLGVETSMIHAIRFFANDAAISSVRADGIVRTWNIATGEVIDTTQLNTSISSASWSPDGNWLAYGGEGDNETLQIIPAPSTLTSDHDIPTTTTPPPPPHPLHSRIWENKMRNLISVLSILALLILANSHPASAQLNSEEAIVAVAWSPDGTMIAGGGTNGLLRVWDVGGSLILDIPDLTGTAFFVVWSPDSQKIAAVGHDTNVRVWNVSDPQYSLGALLATFQGHIDRPEEIAWSPDGTRLASVSVYGESRVFIWDVVSFQPQPIAQTSAAESYAVAWSPDSLKLAIGSSSGILIFDANLNNTSPLINYIKGPIKSVISIAWSPDGNYVIGGYFDPEVIIYNLVDSTQQSLQGHTDYIEAVAWSHDGTRIATSSGDDSVRVWNASTGEELAIFSNVRDVGTSSIAWSPDDTQIAFGGTSQAVRVEPVPNILMCDHDIPADILTATPPTLPDMEE